MKPTKPTGMSGLRLRDRILAVTLSLVTAASMVPTRALAEATAEEEELRQEMQRRFCRDTVRQVAA